MKTSIKERVKLSIVCALLSFTFGAFLSFGVGANINTIFTLFAIAEALACVLVTYAIITIIKNHQV